MKKAFARETLHVITSLGVGATLGAFIWPILLPPNPTLMVLVAAAVAVGHYFLERALRVRVSDGRVSLERGTNEFAEYYREFYQREGSLRIFCEDTEWLEGDAMKPVVEAIGLKGSRATLFLSVLSDEISKRLRARGVRIVQVPEEFALAVKMSYRVNGTERDLMMRGADDGTTPLRGRGKGVREINTFTRTQNPDMVNLAEAIFGAIDKPGGTIAGVVS